MTSPYSPSGKSRSTSGPAELPGRPPQAAALPPCARHAPQAGGRTDPQRDPQAVDSRASAPVHRPSMIPPLLAILLLALCLSPAPLAAQSNGTQRLRNSREALFLFRSVDSASWESGARELWERDPVSLLDSAAGELLQLPPGGVIDVESGARLVGFLVDPEATSWELASAAAGQQQIIREGRRFSSSALPLPGPILLDGRFADWEREPMLSRFRPGGEPLRFIREQRGRRERLPIGEATLWGSPGSRVEELKLRAREDRLFFYLAFSAAPGGESSLFAYIYGSSAETPVATVTLEPASPSPRPVLHTPDGLSLALGNTVVRGRYLEGSITLDEVIEAGSFAVLSTVIEGGSWYEEFPLTRIDLAGAFN